MLARRWEPRNPVPDSQGSRSDPPDAADEERRGQGTSIRPRRSLARPRTRARTPIRIVDWDGWDASEIDPSALLLELGMNVMARYEIWCALHRFDMPTHLKRPPNPQVDWGGARKEDPLRQWVWVRIARRCLRRRIHPIRFRNLVGGDLGDSKYPPPIEHDLRQIDVRCPEMQGAALKSTDLEWRIYGRQLKVRLCCLTGRLDDYNGDELAMVFDQSELSSVPLFVYCIAREYSIHRLTNRLAPLALIQYACLKDTFDAILGDYIPSPLRWAGEALYDFVDREGD
jgi:hypothetical protein